MAFQAESTTGQGKPYKATSLTPVRVISPLICLLSCFLTSTAQMHVVREAITITTLLISDRG
jgi:hypothetical protein